MNGTAAIVLATLRSLRFHWSSEEELQAGIDEALAGLAVPVVREALLDAGRIDFLIDGDVGLEVKVQGSPAAVARQIQRYCYCPEIAALILVTAKSRLADLPATINGKPVHVIELWRANL